jgi:hypothetical protein
VPEFEEHIEAISDFANYRSIWRRDAYRTYFQRRRSSSEAARSASFEPEQLAHKKHWLLHLLKPESYLRIYRQLRNEMVRPIMIAAFEEAIRTFPRRLMRR